MSTSRSSLRHRTLAISALVAGAALAPLPAAFGWPTGTCEPGKDEGCTVDVAIAKASDRDAYAPGDVVTYTITVTNTGDTAVERSRIRVSDPAVPGLAPTGATTGWLSPGETLEWTGTRAITAAECGELPNTATVSLATGKYGGPDDVNPGNDTATRTVVVGGEACAAPAPPAPPAPPVVPVAQSPAAVAPPVKPATRPVCPRPTMRTVVRGAKHPRAGRTVRYRVTVRTTGVTARNVRLRLHVPSGVSLHRVRAGRLHGGDLAVRVGTLRRGHPTTITVTLRLDRSVRGARTLRASVTAKCGGAAATARTVQAIAAAPRRVQPAVTG